MSVSAGSGSPVPAVACTTNGTDSPQRIDPNRHGHRDSMTAPKPGKPTRTSSDLVHAARPSAVERSMSMPVMSSDGIQLPRKRDSHLQLVSPLREVPTPREPSEINVKVRNAIDKLSNERSKKRLKGKVEGVKDDRLREIAFDWQLKTIYGQKELKGVVKEEEVASVEATGAGDRPFGKFLRAAKTVKNLIHVCKVCQSLMEAAVAAEDWYRLMDNFLDTGGGGAGGGGSLATAHVHKARPFVTFVPDDRREGLVQLTFDKSEFARDCRADYLLTDEIRILLQIKAHRRTLEQEHELLRFMKKMFPDFAAYALDIQKRLLACMFYDKYAKSRVITRAGLQADGVYFVLAGSLVEKDISKTELNELKPGQRFGEKDIECGCARRTTVVTRTDVELVTVHRQDYRSICNMADDSNNPKYLEVCRREVVFQHFPLKKLVDNPGVWTVLSYKIGRLIVKDSNDLEWIYIIKKGDARVIKQLRSQKVNLKERHRQIQARLDEADPYKQAQGMIHFVSAETSVQSAYKLGHYQPRLTNSAPPGGGHTNQHSRRKPPPRITLSRSSSRLTDLVGGSSRPNTSMSCPPERTKSASVDPMIKRISSERNRVKGEQERTGVSNKTSPAMWAENKLGLLAHADIDSIAETSYAHRRSITLEKIKIRQDKRASLSIAETEEYEVEYRDQKDRQDHHDICQMEEQDENEATTRNDEDDKDENENIVKIDNLSSDERVEGKYSSTASKAHKPKVRIADVVDSLSKKDSSYLQTGSRHGGGHARSRKTSTSSSVLSADKELLVDVPPFVQLETLTPGRIFGMRSCLDEEERGPSASLISGGCEVLQINKKFFLKNADEALIALIRLQHKPYPSEEDLLDRLDVNFQWDSFKKSTVNGFVRELKKRKGVVT